MNEPAKSIIIYIDADACPVKAEVYRVAERYVLKVYVVSNSYMAVPREPLIERIVVGDVSFSHNQLGLSSSDCSS